MKKKMAFRINLKENFGLGHLIRCLRIANKLKKKYQIYFIFDKLNEKSEVRKYLYNFKIINIYSKSKFINEKRDSKKFLSAFSKTKLDVVIVDDYRIGKIWHVAIKNKVSKLIVIDDLLDKKYYCDYYINYKCDTKKTLFLKAKRNCNKNAKLLIGNKYSLIGKNLIKKKKINSRKNILINFGNYFDFNQAKILLQNLVKRKKTDKFKIFLCIGIFGKNYKYLLNLSKKNNDFKIIYKKLFIEDVISKMDFYIGSCGNALYEMSYLNIPSIFFSMSKNQENKISDLEKYGHYFLLKREDLNTLESSNLVREFVKNYKRIVKLNYTKRIFLKKNGLDLIIKKINL